MLSYSDAAYVRSVNTCSTHWLAWLWTSHRGSQSWWRSKGSWNLPERVEVSSSVESSTEDLQHRPRNHTESWSRLWWGKMIMDVVCMSDVAINDEWCEPLPIFIRPPVTLFRITRHYKKLEVREQSMTLSFGRKFGNKLSRPTHWAWRSSDYICLLTKLRFGHPIYTQLNGFTTIIVNWCLEEFGELWLRQLVIPD